MRNDEPSMLWNLYIRNGIVYVPTVAKTEAGFYMDIDPVRTVPVVESDRLQAAVAAAISDGNPAIPTPSYGAFPKPVILKHAAVRSWAAFERSATYWRISEKEGRYCIGPGRRAADRGWEGPVHEELLPAGTTVNTVAQRVASLLADAART